MLTFDAGPHVYRWNDTVVPSVTGVLSTLENSFEFVDPGVLEAARAFGRNVHRAIELYNLDELDEEVLDPALVPYLAQWKRFLRDTGFEVTAGEQRVYHTLMRYAGTLDIRGHMRGRNWLLDLKSGAVPKTAQLQTAGYVLAADVGHHRMKRAALQLSAERYNLIKHEDSADFAYFQSAVNLHHWRQKHGN